jgi:hypothetical protein
MSAFLRTVTERFIVLAALLVCACVVASCSRPDDPPPPPPPSADKVDQDLMDRAFHDCFVGDCDRAYAHMSELSPKSPLRHGDAFRAVQYRYDADRLLHADVEPDPTKRHALYQEISDSKVTDSILRLAASERMARLGATGVGAGRETALNALADAGPPGAAAATQLLEKSKSKNPTDWSQVRAAIEPKIFSGKASRDDVAMLRTVCKAEKDTTCLQQLDHLILR